MEKFEKAFGEWVIHFRWGILFFSLLFVIAAGTGTKNLYFTTNYRVFFSDDNPQLLAFEALENTYTKNDNVLFVLQADNGNVFTRETLAAVEYLTERAWQVPYSNRVDSITNFQYTEAEEDDLTVRDLVKNAGSLTDEELEHVRNTAITEPLLINRLISNKGNVTGVNVTIQLPRINEATETPEIIVFSRNLAKEIESKFPQINVRLTGMIFMNNAFAESSKNDMAYLIPISFALMLLLLAMLVGGITGTFSTIFVIAFSIVTAMGIGGYIGFPISPPSATSPTIILTVAIANCVHILVTFLHGMRQGMEKNAALVESLRINLQPVFLASITTAIGFLMMNFSDVPPFNHLGNFVAIGVITSFIMSVTFLPALMSLLPVKVKQTKDDHDVAMEKVGNFVVRQRSILLWGMSAVILLLLLGLPRNQLNDIFVHYFDTSIPFRTDSDFTTDNLTGIYTIEYSLESGEPGGISKPEFLHDVEAFADWYRQQPEVLHINTVTDIMKRLNKNMHGDDSVQYVLPEARDLSAQYLLLYEMSLPYGLDLNNQINVDKSSTRLTATLKTLSTNDLLDLELRAKKWLTNNAPNIKAGDGSGTSIMFAHIGHRNIISMLYGTTLALILISIVLIFALRSIKIGLVSLIPNLAPAAMGFGLWGLFVGEIGLSLSVVTTMTLGIVIDDTVHFLSKYLRARREKNLQPEDAVRYAFVTVGRALIYTSVILVCGFMVLATSNFELNSGMGLLTAVVISLAIIADFLFLPPLLMKIEEKLNAEKQSVPDTVSDTAAT
jgi:uncharacterized protein